MFKLIHAELVKLKRQKILFLIPAGIVFPTLLGIKNWIGVRSTYGANINMKYLLPLVEMDMANGILMMAIIFITVWIFVNEYRNNSIDYMFMYPYARGMFMLAKLALVFFITVFMVLAIFLLTVFYGTAVMKMGIYPDLLYYHLRVCLVIVLLFYSLVPACVTVCIISKSYVVPAAVTLVIYLLVPLLNLFDFHRILPWNVPTYIIQSVQMYLNPRFDLYRISNYTPYILSSVITFTGPLIFNLKYYTGQNR